MSLSSSVCMIAKNEAPYLVEWVAYHRLLGFKEVIVYENNSDDNSALILKSLADAGKITYRPWLLGKNESPQETAYRDAVRRARTDWILFIDCDEFLVLHEHNHVNDFLAPFHARKEVTAIGLNWRVFGSSGQSGNDGRLVTERFTKAATDDFVPNRHLKSFLRVRKIGRLIHMHISQTSGKVVHASGRDLNMENWGLSDEVDLSVAQVNHYYTKSLEEYQIKKRRGQGGAGENQPELKYWYSDEVFHIHDRNDLEDLSIGRWATALNAEVSQLRALVPEPVIA